MQPINALKAAFQNYATFSGRATRGDYWWYLLAYLLVTICLSVVDSVLFGGASSSHSAGGVVAIVYSIGIFGTLWDLANLIPSIAVAARRLHDTGRSGWWQLLVLIPVLGWIALIYFLVQKGTAGENRFGADPLA
jgi:uncharacterized membrane protein YhaH (DUF805 family)